MFLDSSIRMRDQPLHLRCVELQLLVLNWKVCGFAYAGNQQSLVAIAGNAEADGVELAVERQAWAFLCVAQIAKVTNFRFFQLRLLVSRSRAVTLPASA